MITPNNADEDFVILVGTFTVFYKLYLRNQFLYTEISWRNLKILKLFTPCILNQYFH
jgi:hypothetical protein